MCEENTAYCSDPRKLDRFITGVFRDNFPVGKKERKHEGIEVLGRPEVVHF